MTPMTLAERMAESRERQARRGRLRWLVDDFCRRELNAPLRPGELLDLGDDVRAFAEADDVPEPTEDDLLHIQQAVRSGLGAVFNHQPWSLGRPELLLHVPLDPRNAKRKPPKGTVREDMVTRLWLPLGLMPRRAGTLAERCNVAAALEVAKGWQRLARCPRCESFFYRVRRQLFCSPKCKQEAMDERKRGHVRGATGWIEPLPGHRPLVGLEHLTAPPEPRKKPARRPPKKGGRAARKR